MHFTITAFWDSEASVWIASNDELGLVAEAQSLDMLVDKIRQLVPDLVELNGLAPQADTVPYDLLVRENQHLPA